MNLDRKLITALLVAGLAASTWAAPKYPFPRAGTYKYGVKAGTTYAPALGGEINTAFKAWKTAQLDSSGSMMRVKFDNTTYTVSEGIGYGMLIMVYMDNTVNNTQGQFDKLWAYYKNFRNSNGLMHWKIQGFSSANQQNGATDAELDVALALLMAYKQWGNAQYLTDAKSLISIIWNKEVASNRLKPGDAWDDYKNPSYFSPGALELFKLVDANGWDAVMTSEYSMIKANQNATTGITSDWCTTSGSAVQGKETKQMGMNYDGVRTPWRLAIGYAWFGHPDAKIIDDKLTNWLTSSTSPIANKVANIKDGYRQDGTATSTYYVATFVGAFGAAGMTNADRQAWVNSTYAQLKVGADGSGYYHSSLKVLYQLLMSGNFNNFWDSASMASTSIPTRERPLAGATVLRQGRQLTVDAGAVTGLQADVIDLKGRTLRTGSAQGSNLSLDLTGLAQGIYTIRLKSTAGGEARSIALTGN